MKVWCDDLTAEYDVIVVGSGAIGLTAALAAHSRGARVAVLEKADFLGGTAAVSGGMVWVPMNKEMLALGASDRREAALEYLTTLVGGRTDLAMLATLVDHGPQMLEFVAGRGLHMRPLDNFPDYHPEWSGAHQGGRSLEPILYDGTLLGDLADSVRPDSRLPFTMLEYEQWQSFMNFPWDELRERAANNAMARGRALVAPLIRACGAAGITLVTGFPITHLVTDEGRVCGVIAADGEQVAARAVIIASGGFEWNPDMCKDFLPGPVEGSCSPPHNTGDGIRMAAKIGAKLGGMNQAWWNVMVHIPGDETDGSRTGTLLRFERTGPRTIIVNEQGQRFVNEAHNYNDMGRAFHVFDPRSYRLVNLPAYLIFDHEHLVKYGFLTHRAGEPKPSWIVSDDSIEGLAAELGVDPAGLTATLARFNENARQGIDPDFHRGESAYDNYWGDKDAEHPALGPVETAPFYAIRIRSGVIGTKGGIVTDEDGSALDVFGIRIDGLFAAGNTTAHPMGPGYPGAGGTLGPGMTMGYLAGLKAATEAAAPERSGELRSTTHSSTSVPRR